MMNYLDAGLALLKEIESKGYKAYIIGGAVRDFLLNMPINDIDITTNMPISLIKEEYEVILNGLNYLSISIKYNGYIFEVTNFRYDISYTDHRHPIVSLCDNLYDDTLRRDLTINAIAYDSNKNLIDYHNGINDIENHLIKMIGDPLKRFEEDSLRILRCLYFSNKLDFDIEKNTLDAIIKKSYLLKELSYERIYEYIFKLNEKSNNKGISYIIIYDLFKDINEFKELVHLLNKGYTNDELLIAYSFRYNKYLPNISSKIKKLCDMIMNIKNNNYDSYSLYQYIEYKDLIIKITNNKDIEKRVDSFVIKKDSELKMSKEEIASYFEGKNKSIAIKEVITEILNNNLCNDYIDIKKYVMEEIKCKIK